jgi:hypothetical protein
MELLVVEFFVTMEEILHVYDMSILPSAFHVLHYTRMRGTGNKS